MVTAPSKNMPPSKKRYDKEHPTVSVRMSNATRKKLEKYKKEGMSWVDVIMMLVENAEEGALKEEIREIVRKKAEENKRLNKEFEELLLKNSELISEMSEKENEILQKLERICEDLKFRVKTIEGFLNAKFPGWQSYATVLRIYNKKSPLQYNNLRGFFP